MKYKNPVDYVHFYSKWAPNESFSMPREKVIAFDILKIDFC